MSEKKGGPGSDAFVDVLIFYPCLQVTVDDETPSLLYGSVHLFIRVIDVTVYLPGRSIGTSPPFPQLSFCIGQPRRVQRLALALALEIFNGGSRLTSMHSNQNTCNRLLGLSDLESRIL